MVAGMMGKHLYHYISLLSHSLCSSLQNLYYGLFYEILFQISFLEQEQYLQLVYESHDIAAGVSFLSTANLQLISYHSSQNFMLLAKGEFNHITIILIFP